MIRLQGVSKNFGAIEALAPMDLEIRAGEWLGIFGRNGSGKTSLLRILVGLSRPSSGSLSLGGNVPDSDQWLNFRRRLGFMPERIRFHEHLSGEKILRFFARLRGVDAAAVLPMLDRVGLADVAGRPSGGYSKGMLQRLNLAQALLGDPPVLILDEPLEGFDPHGVRLFFELLRSVPERTIILSSHRLSSLSGLVDRICILAQGRLRALGTEEELTRRLNLPFRVILHPLPGADAKIVSLLNGRHLSCTVSDTGKISVRVPQAHKMAFLSQLKELQEAIQDVRIEEPSLEEVFLETS